MRFRTLQIWLSILLSVFGAQGATAEKPLVLVHVMPWFEAPPTHSQWGWHWSMDQTQPAQGKIAAHVHPLIGPYDSANPKVIAYQVALMKAAGIDGAIIDWNGLGGFSDYAMMHHNTSLLIEALKRSQLQFAICAEDNSGRRFESETHLSRPDSLQKLTQSFQWLDTHWLTDPAYVKIQNHPALFLFGPQYLEPTEWLKIQSGLHTQPFTFCLPHLKPAAPLHTFFAWIPVREGQSLPLETCLQELDQLYADTTQPVKAAVAFPGYHDFYREAHQGKSYGFIHDREGVTFQKTLDQAFQSKAPIIQIATWNDYGEGTVIEPTQEAGHRYLEILQQKIKPGANPAALRQITQDFLQPTPR